MSTPAYMFSYEREKDFETNTIVYRARLDFKTKEPTHHLTQIFEVDIDEDIMDAMFAQMVIDQLVPKVKEVLPKLFAPDPRGKLIKTLLFN